MTGEESYHADCFRCRSCSQKIEELVFAKTSQGIWCMACHNERVAKSRKKAEASKRRKEKAALANGEQLPSRSSRSRVERERDRDRDRDREPSGSGPSGAEGSDNTTASYDHHTAQHRPLPASPVPPSGSNSAFSIYADPPSHQGTPGTPGTTPTKLRPDPSQARITSSPSLNPSPSSQSLSSIHRGGSPLAVPSPARSRSNSVERERQAERRPSHEAREAESPAPSPRPYGRQAEYEWNVASPREVNGSPSLHVHTDSGSRQGSLSAPSTDKGQRRRSGFYGALGPGGSRPSIDEEIPANVSEDGGASLDGHGVGDSPAPPSTSEGGGGGGGSTAPFLPEMHSSASFYDSDTLLFLHNVGGADRAQGYSAELAGLPEEQIEQLSPHLGTRSGEGDDDDGNGNGGRPRPPKSEVARKVRESIQISRTSQHDELGAGPKGLDVELVEMLLAELETTKKELQEMQDKYNTFRRASRSAFEGFSMARDEYDKELAARREVEAKMGALVRKFAEQSKRLAQVDHEKSAADDLRRQSTQLQSSISTMEKHASQLQADIQLSTAQAAVLAEVAGADPSRPPPAGVVSPTELAQTMAAKFEALRDGHRREIAALNADRDALAKEVDQLRQVKELYAREADELAEKNVAVAQANVDATRHLEMLKDTIARLRAAGAAAGAGAGTGLSLINGASSHSLSSGRGHTSSSSHSSLSTGLPPVTTRSPLGAARNPAASPTPQPYDRDLEHLHRFAKPEAAEPQVATAKKFKWGKSSSGNSSSKAAQAQALDPNGPSSARPPVPGSASKPSPVVPRSGSTDGGARPHDFHAVTVVRPVRCEYCGDKTWGSNVRCASCATCCHVKCAPNLIGPCPGSGAGASAGAGSADQDLTGPLPTGPPMFGNDLTIQVRSEGGQVPVVVDKCIGAVEAHGMMYEGIYRKSGGMGQTKLITQMFERGADFNLEDLDKFNDLASITSCLKNFFRSLPDPLFTHALHEDFVSCAELADVEARLNAIGETLGKLPEAHFHTARFLLGHLHKVHLNSATNKMTPANLGVVFGRKQRFRPSPSLLAVTPCPVVADFVPASFPCFLDSRSHDPPLVQPDARVFRHGTQG